MGRVILKLDERGREIPIRLRSEEVEINVELGVVRLR